MADLPPSEQREKGGKLPSEEIDPAKVQRAQSPGTNESELDPIRTVGQGMHLVSDIVNDNLIAARYGALACIGLLTAYGISQTPLFFRYRTVAEIPSRLFTERKSLTGRLMVCRDKSGIHNDATAAVTCFVRHLSPVERLLSRSWLDWLLKIHPAATLQRDRPEESPHELLRVQVAGLVYPSLPEQNNTSNGNHRLENIFIGAENGTSSVMKSQPRNVGQELLQQLAEERVVVKCKLLGRRVAKPPEGSVENGNRVKRPIPGFDANVSSRSLDDDNQVAVAYVHYYPKQHPFLGADMGSDLVRGGHAIPSPDGGLYAHAPTEHVVDATTDIPTLRKDAAYLKTLDGCESEACRGLYGVWATSEFRESRADVVTEVDFQQNAPFWRKAWRWLRMLRR